MRTQKTLAVTLAAAMLLSVFAMGGGVAAVAATNAAANDSVEPAISVAQNDDVTVTVTDSNADDEPVANATVDVTLATDDENVSYAGTGTYTTGANGTVTLPTPSGNESVDVAITATVGDATAETTATLEPDGPSGFGELVSQFVHEQRNETDGPLGLAVASFVVENNPGNAPAHAGPPEHAGPPGDGEKTQGPPEHAGQSDDDDKGGPPAHAGPDGDKKTDADDEDDDSSGNGGGPPDHAGK